MVKMISSLMVSQLYQYSSIKQNYLNELFLEVNVRAYESLEQFADLLIEQFIVVEDEFNLVKFIVDYDVFARSMLYL